MILWISLLIAPPAAAGGEGVPAVVPVGEVRINWDFGHLENPGGEGRGEPFAHGFSVPRAELGLVAHVSSRIQTRTVLHATQAHGADYPRGWAVQAQDVYATIQPLETDDFWIQPGVQMTILGSRNLFDEARDSYYLVGPRTEELAELAAVVHGRDLGLRVHGVVAEKLTIDGMVANGNGHTGIGEDNTAKDLSLRLDYGLTRQLHLILSGQRAVDGPEGEQEDLVLSLMSEWRAERLRLMVETIGGTDELDTGERREFLGVQGGLSLERAHQGDLVESQALTGRFGFFDPRIQTVDADAWMTADLSLQNWWHARSPMGFMTGLGYNLWVPMDITVPVGHSVSLQALFQI
jgi:hypothetical protein